MDPGRKYFAFLLLMTTFYWLPLTTNGQSAETYRLTDKDQRKFTWPPYLHPLAMVLPLTSGITRMPSQLANRQHLKQSSAETQGRQFYGVVNIYRPNGTSNESPLNPIEPEECEVCEKCDPPCRATTYPALPISITFGNTDICTGTVANPYGPCTRVSAAPRGNFIITWMVAGSSTAFNGAFIGIVATCPNSKIKLTCENIPKGIHVSTQTRAISTGEVAIQSPDVITENDFMQVIVKNTGVTDVFSIVKCSWEGLP